MVAGPEVSWLGPIPDALVTGPAEDPAAIAVARESLRLGLIACLQYLPARQRAVLILRDVLAFPAAEVAAMLGTSTVGGQEHAAAGQGAAGTGGAFSRGRQRARRARGPGPAGGLHHGLPERRPGRAGAGAAQGRGAGAGRLADLVLRPRHLHALRHAVLRRPGRLADGGHGRQRAARRGRVPARRRRRAPGVRPGRAHRDRDRHRPHRGVRRSRAGHQVRFPALLQ